ncbi:MAG: hemerythrin domain-containing protein [Chloroflexi bacterium]|nr:hemerythrin domain-containing protein [Chloroflexota bacterium]
MNATDELMNDHRTIERMLTILNTAASKADAGQDLPPDFFTKVVDFIRNFADKAHHGKEEDNLFPAMEKRGIPRQGGPIAVMLNEHDLGRTYVRGMDDAGHRLMRGDREALTLGAKNAHAYADLLAQHIRKEDNILYAMADRVLSQSDQKNLLTRFSEIDKERLGPEKRQQYMSLLDELERELSIKA